METKYKEQIKGAVLSTGVWIVLLGLSPKLDIWYSSFNNSIFIGAGLIAIGWFLL